jgi:hypothetical protein
MNRTPKLSKHIKWLILTADGSPGITNWLNKVGTANICVCDADRGHFFSLENSIKDVIPVYLAKFVKDELFCAVTTFQQEAMM